MFHFIPFPCFRGTSTEEISAGSFVAAFCATLLRSRSCFPLNKWRRPTIWVTKKQHHHNSQPQRAQTQTVCSKTLKDWMNCAARTCPVWNQDGILCQVSFFCGRCGALSVNKWNKWWQMGRSKLKAKVTIKLMYVLWTSDYLILLLILYQWSYCTALHWLWFSQYTAVCMSDATC